MNKTLSRLLPLVFALVVAGCLQSKRQYVINPDGSGKLTIEVTMTRPDLLMGETDDSDTKESKKKKQEELRAKIAEIIGESEGIDAWRDVSYKDLGSGKTYFKGTAYFPDFNTVRLKGLSNMDFHLGMDGANMTLTVVDESDSEATVDTATLAALAKLPEEEVKRRADSIRQEFTMSMSMMRMAFNELSETATFRLPGKVTTSQAFTARRGSQYQIVFSGKRLVDVMDSLSKQEGFFEKMVRYGGKPPMEDESARLAIWGGEKPLLVTQVGAKPLFNYAREVRQSKKYYDNLRKKLGVE